MRIKSKRSIDPYFYASLLDRGSEGRDINLDTFSTFTVVMVQINALVQLSYGKLMI
jgi:hypothetical protein